MLRSFFNEKIEKKRKVVEINSMNMYKYQEETVKWM